MVCDHWIGNRVSADVHRGWVKVVWEIFIMILSNFEVIKFAVFVLKIT